MTPQQLKAMKLALEALSWEWGDEPPELIGHAIAALKEALAQPEQEPVAWMVVGNGEYGEYEIGRMLEKKTDPNFKYWEARGYELVPLYTHPPQRKPLTDEEMKKIWYAMQNIMGWYSFQEIARAIEAAHGIKENT